MVKEKIERKITVIFATDVVGYSKHMEADESETIHNLRECEAILTGLFEKHDGRLFNTGGDSFLAEFPSAVSAVECAVDFQSVIKERNASADTSVKLEFRIGINSGDVVKEKDNLLGDGVNIAARLEALAQTNGITVSKVIYDYVKGKTKYDFNDLGIQKVKQNEFHAFDLVLDISQRRKLKTPRTKTYPIFISLLVLVLSILGYFSFSLKDGEKISQKGSNLPIVLVKPFKNMIFSNADGLSVSDAVTEALISTLQQYQAITLLSTSTSYYSVEKDMSDEEIAAKYGVEFLINGSVQKSGDQIRVTSELIDLNQNRVLWSDKLDVSDNELFQLQDNLSRHILDALEISATSGIERGNGIEEFDDYVLMMNTIRYQRQFTQDSWKKSNNYLQDFLKSNSPDFHKVWLSGYDLFVKIAVGLSENIPEDIKKLVTLSDEALSISQDHITLTQRALIESVFLKNCEQAIAYAEKATASSPNAIGLQLLGISFVSCGEFSKGIRNLENALLKTPNDTDFIITKNLLTSYMMNREFKLASQLADRIVIDGFPSLYILKAYAKAKEGKTRSAKKILADYNSLPNILNKEQFIAKLGAINGKKQFSDQVFRELTELGLSSS